MLTEASASDMKKDKFLTVMAVYDGNTQNILSNIQKKVITALPNGTQTMDIPFHITLGSYSPEMEGEITKMVKEAARVTAKFPIQLLGYKDFGNKVLFAEPSIPPELIELRKCFESDYAESYPWVPHTTLFCGDEDLVIRATTLLPEIDDPINAEIVGLELGEFFPTRMIMKEDFK